MHGTLDRQRDEQILMALHLVENMGMTNRQPTKTAAKDSYGGLIRHLNLGYQCLIR